MEPIKVVLVEKYPLHQYIAILAIVVVLSLILIIVLDLFWIIAVLLASIISAIYIYTSNKDKLAKSSYALQLAEKYFEEIKVEWDKIILPREEHVEEGIIKIIHLTHVFGGHEYKVEFHPLGTFEASELPMKRTWYVVVDQEGTVYIRMPAYKLRRGDVSLVFAYALPLVLEEQSGELEVEYENEKGLMKWYLEGTDLEGLLIYKAVGSRKVKGVKGELVVEYPHGIFRIKLAEATVPNYDYSFSERLIIPFDTPRVFIMYPQSLFYTMGKLFKELLKMLDIHKIGQPMVAGDLSEVETSLKLIMDIPVKQDIIKEEKIVIRAHPISRTSQE